MEHKLLKELLDACFSAKRIVELMPPLPKGFKPRHIHIIDIIEELSRVQERVIVSDVCAKLGVTAPGITRLINELEAKGALLKEHCEEDRRYIRLSLTPKGKGLYKKYVHYYHQRLIALFDSLEIEDCQATINILNTMLHLMESHTIDLESENE